MTPVGKAREERRLGLGDGPDPFPHVPRARQRAMLAAVACPPLPLNEASYRDWSQRLAAAGHRAPAPWWERGAAS